MFRTERAERTTLLEEFSALRNNKAATNDILQLQTLHSTTKTHSRGKIYIYW